MNYQKEKVSPRTFLNMLPPGYWCNRKQALQGIYILQTCLDCMCWFEGQTQAYSVWKCNKWTLTVQWPFTPEPTPPPPPLSVRLMNGEEIEDQVKGRTGPYACCGDYYTDLSLNLTAVWQLWKRYILYLAVPLHLIFSLKCVCVCVCEVKGWCKTSRTNSGVL